jgi:hypothetical protein
MVNASDLIGGGLPVGDKLRFGSQATLAGTPDITVLNVASGGGVLHGVYIGGLGNDIRISEIKVTVDGAAERTFDLLDSNYVIQASTSNAQNIYAPLPISFKTSLVLKMTNVGSGTAYAQAMYTIK